MSVVSGLPSDPLAQESWILRAPGEDTLFPLNDLQPLKYVWFVHLSNLQLDIPRFHSKFLWD